MYMTIFVTYIINREVIFLTAVIPTNTYKLQHLILFYNIFPHVLHQNQEQYTWV